MQERPALGFPDPLLACPDPCFAQRGTTPSRITIARPGDRLFCQVYHYHRTVRESGTHATDAQPAPVAKKLASAYFLTDAFLS